jgi:uncharacterized protein (TIGR02996 family)
MSAPDPLSAFYLALEDVPDDRLTLLALADWYEEEGGPDAADCLRWTVRNAVWPFRYSVNSGLSVSSAVWHDGWFWWSVDEPFHGRDWGHDPHCLLPAAVWQKLRHTFNYDPAVFKEYPTRRSAYEALIEAWPRVGAVVDREPFVREAYK